MKFEIQSFGYRYGMPEAEVVLDMRCLENPYWVPELRELCGLDGPVRDYILNNTQSLAFIRQCLRLMELQAELAACRGRETISLAVGCTGGQHRSVTAAAYLAQALEAAGHTAWLRHRDLQRKEGT